LLRFHGLHRDGKRNNVPNLRRLTMAQRGDSASNTQTDVHSKVWWHVSVDGWAVALALGLALLVWIGAIKTVSW
jgi:hypothetical protein